MASFVVTEDLSKRLQESNLTGYALAAVRVTKSSQFRELFPNRKLPKCHWLRITGKAGIDDFGLSTEHRLVVSGLALEFLQRGSLFYSRVQPLPESKESISRTSSNCEGVQE
jgi:hypothetical protein